MYSQAVDKQNPKGKTRFFESYRNPLTGDLKTVSVTMDKNTTQSRKTAQKVLDGKIKAILDKTVGSTGKGMTLSELIKRYNLDQELDGSIKESTWLRNHRQMKACERIIGGNVLVNNLTAAYVNDQFRNSGDANGTINERTTRFKAMLRWANQNGYVKDISWLSGIKTYQNVESKEKLKEKFMERSELNLVLESMKVERWKFVTAFLALSGLRIGEFIALDREDIVWTDKTALRGNIEVRKTFHIERRKVVNSTKTENSSRKVFIQPELGAVIREIEEYVSAQDLATHIFFPDTNGDYMRYDAYRKYLGETTEKVIGRRLTPHALRHTHTSLLAEKGVPLEVISRRLGHGDSEVTRQVYLHVTKGMEESDNELLSAISLLT